MLSTRFGSKTACFGGDNTDAYGFSANLDDGAPQWRDRKSATVLGAGGAAKAIVFALCQANFTSVKIVNRTVARAQNLAEQFGGPCSAHRLEDAASLFPKTDVLINTTSIGMSGGGQGEMPDPSTLPNHAIVNDIVYVPLETPLLKEAKSLGLETVDGLGMLLHQAVPGFEKWFGIRPHVTKELRAHMLDQL